MISKKDIYEWYHSVKKKRIQSIDLEKLEELRQKLKKKFITGRYGSLYIKHQIDEVFGVEGEK